MRLKFLFFPIVLVMSLIIFVTYLWPEIGQIKILNDQYKTDRQTLENINSKRADIKSLNNDLIANESNSLLVYSFFPDRSSDEKIINILSHLANSSGLSILDISLDRDTLSSTAVAEDITGSSLSIIGNLQQATPSDVPTKLEGEVKFAKARISVVGEYEKLQLYLDKLRKMEIYNTISNVNILMSKKEDAQLQSTLGVGGNGTLNATIAVNFGYLPKVKGANYNTDLLSGAKFDFTIADRIRGFVTQKVPVIDIGQVGKDNPFLP